MKSSIEVKFKLKSGTNSDGTRLIIANTYFNSQRLTISTGISLDPSLWDIDTGSLMSNYPTKEARVINRTLVSVRQNLTLAYDRLLDMKDSPAANEVREKYLELSGKKKRNRITLLSCINNHIERARNGELINSVTNKPYSEGIIAVYEKNKRYLLEYSKQELRKPELDFNDVCNDNFYIKFKKFLATTEMKHSTRSGRKFIGGKLSPNTIGLHIKTIKTFLNAARTYEGVTLNYNYSKAFKVTKIPQKKIFLTLDELEQIQETEFQELGLDQARDWLIITCFTGLRVSDFKRLRPQHFDLKSETITIETQKTGERVTIPILPPLRKVIEKYKAQGKFLPSPFADPVLNRYLKQVALKAGITASVLLPQKTDKGFIEVTVPKCSQVSTKTGRVSFISNMRLLKVSKENIKQITGHKSDSVFAGYDSVDGETNAKSVSVDFNKRTAKLTAV